MIPMSPPLNSSGRSSPEDEIRTPEDRELASVAEKIKFQITIDDPDQD